MLPLILIILRLYILCGRGFDKAELIIDSYIQFRCCKAVPGTLSPIMDQIFFTLAEQARLNRTLNLFLTKLTKHSRLDRQLGHNDVPIRTDMALIL